MTSYTAGTPSTSSPQRCLKYKGSIGLEVDKQQITIAARPTDLVGTAPFLIALRDGAFDGAPVYRDRVFLTGPMGTVVGGVRLFQGRISTVDNVGRTQATLTVASDLVILDYDMPKNLFSATCLHVLYDTGCGVIRGTFSLDGTCGAGSTSGTIYFSGARAGDAQGSLVFTSGANSNVRATVKSVVVGSAYNLMYPLPFAPTVGDAFNVAYGWSLPGHHPLINVYRTAMVFRHAPRNWHTELRVTMKAERFLTASPTFHRF